MSMVDITEVDMLLKGPSSIIQVRVQDLSVLHFFCNSVPRMRGRCVHMVV